MFWGLGTQVQVLKVGAMVVVFEAFAPQEEQGFEFLPSRRGGDGEFMARLCPSLSYLLRCGLSLVVVSFVGVGVGPPDLGLFLRTLSPVYL